MSRINKQHLVLALILAGFIAPCAFAQPAEADATAAAEATPNPQGTAYEIVITDVRGLVQVRPDDQAPWAVAQAGQAVPIGGEFRTGPRSSVSFAIGSEQAVTLERLGVVKILQAIQGADGKARTEVGMKYGRSVMQVEEGGLEHESTIRTPSAVLAIRGSRGFVQEYRHSLLAGADTGDVSWTNSNLRGKQLKLPPGSNHTGESTSTASNNANTGTFNPLGGSSTPDEVALFSNNPNGFFAGASNGATGNRGNDTAPEVFENFFEPIPGALAFELQWISADSPTGFVDIEFSVIDPLSRETGSFNGDFTQTMPDAGTLGHDNFPNESNPGGIAREGVFFPTESDVLDGLYTTRIQHFSGDAADYQLRVFIDQQQTGSAITDIISGGQQHFNNFNVDTDGDITVTDLGDSD